MMNSRNLFTVALAAGLFFAPVTLGAQSKPGQSAGAAPAATASEAGPTPPGPTRIVQNVNEVSVVFSALDKHHHLIQGLQPNQVQVFDNNHPQQIVHFANEGNLPLRIAILVDTSSSIRDRFQFEQQAMINFLNSVVRPSEDKAMVVSFDSTVEVVQGFTSSPDKLRRAIQVLRPGGGTALYDAVYDTVKEQMSTPDPNVRKVIVLVSDGADTQSRWPSPVAAIREALNQGVTVFTVSTEATGIDPKSDDVLKKIAGQTGGLSLFPFEANQLVKSFGQIANELRHQYVVDYHPNDFQPDGSFHRVTVKLAIKKAKARTRVGYYAQNESESAEAHSPAPAH